MNKRTGWENEATTRAINARPWEPPPGMVKQQCPDCRYWFAAPVHRVRTAPLSRLRGKAVAGPAETGVIQSWSDARLALHDLASVYTDVARL